MGTTKELEELKAALAEAPRNQQGHRRYSEALKRSVTEYARRRQRGGTEPLHAIADEIGVSADTLWGWLHRSDGDAGRSRERESGLPERAKEFRAALRALGARARTTPFPPELRALALTHFKQRRSAGASIRDVATELGVGTDTLRRWSGSRERSRSSVRRVRVASPTISSPASRCTLLVYGPAGLRVEGLDVAMVAALWKELS
jgi:transposase-like protein